MNEEFCILNDEICRRGSSRTNPISQPGRPANGSLISSRHLSYPIVWLDIALWLEMACLTSSRHRWQ